MLLLTGEAVFESGLCLIPRDVDAAVVGKQWHGTFVEVEAHVVAARSGAEHDDLQIGGHGYNVEVVPVLRNALHVVGHVVASRKTHKRQQRHHGFGVSKPQHHFNRVVAPGNEVVGRGDEVVEQL